MQKNILTRFYIWISVAIIFCAGKISAQEMHDSTLSFPFIGVQAGFAFPGADLAKSYGYNFSVGASYWRKTKYDVLLGLEYNYIFGDQVKINPMDSISNSNGYVINSVGQFTSVQVYERGHFVMLKAGKIFPGTGPNPSSGLMVKGGVGFWLTQIYYYWNGPVPAQFSGNYIDGYDRLSYGPAFSESFGYINFSNNHRLNFSIELEIAEGFLKDVRAYSYDIRQTENSTQFDLSFGLKAAWYFPLYKKAKEKYYY